MGRPVRIMKRACSGMVCRYKSRAHTKQQRGTRRDRQEQARRLMLEFRLIHHAETLVSQEKRRDRKSWCNNIRDRADTTMGLPMLGYE